MSSWGLLSFGLILLVVAIIRWLPDEEDDLSARLDEAERKFEDPNWYEKEPGWPRKGKGDDR